MASVGSQTEDLQVEVEMADAATHASFPLTHLDPYPGLVSFLSSAEAPMSAALSSAISSDAFLAYSGGVSGFAAPGSGEGTLTAFCILRNQLASSSESESESESKSKSKSNMEGGERGWCVDVSKTGNLVGVGYGYGRRHSDWCEHEDGRVAVWRMGTSRMDAEKPDFVLHSGVCVRSLAFHPEKNACLAYGTFDGRVVVVNSILRAASLVQGKGEGDDDGLIGGRKRRKGKGKGKGKGGLARTAGGVHTEPVVELQWYATGARQNAVLLSMCSGGKVLLWDGKEGTPVASCGYTLHTRRLGSPDCPLGGTVFALSVADAESGTFIVGTETGHLLQGSLTRHPAVLLGSYDKPASSSEYSDPPFGVTPIVYAFESPASPVLAIAMSPHFGSLFVAGYADGSIRMYVLRAAEPLAVWTMAGGAPVSSLAWSPHRPGLIFAGTLEGHLVAYNVARGSAAGESPLLVVDLDAPIITLALSAQPPGSLVVGCEGGEAHVFMLSDSLARPGVGERVGVEGFVGRVP